MAADVVSFDIVKCVALSYKLGAAPKDFIRKEKFRIKLPHSAQSIQQLKELLR